MSSIAHFHTAICAGASQISPDGSRKSEICGAPSRKRSGMEIKMQFGITIPLQKALKIRSLPYGEPQDLFFCWELHGITWQGKETLFVTNANNGFSVILWGMKAGDWKNYPQLVTDGIREGLTGDGYTAEQADRYLELAGPCEITKTHGRRPVSALNREIDLLYYGPAEADKSGKYQRFYSHYINCARIKGPGFGIYGSPSGFLERDMRRAGIIKDQAYIDSAPPLW